MESQPQLPYYEDEIDLRELIKTVWRYKWVILVVALLAAAAAYVSSAHLLPKNFQSAAVVLINQPDTTVERSPGYAAIPNTETLISVAQSLDSLADLEIPGVEFVHKARIVSQNLIRLDVTASTPKQAADLANRWAQAFSFYVQESFSEEFTIEKLELQLDSARQIYNETEAKLEAEYINSQANLLEIQLQKNQSIWQESVSQSIDIHQTINAVQAMDAKLLQQIPGKFLTWGQFVSLVALHQRAIGDELLLLSSDFIPTEYTTLQARDSLANLLDVLLQDEHQLASQIESLEIKIAAGELELELVRNDLQIYLKERDWALDDYFQARKQLLTALQSKIGDELDQPIVEIIQRAEIPDAPISPKPLTNTALGGVVGLMLAVGTVFMRQWWRDQNLES